MDLRLAEHQRAHYARIHSNLERNNIYFDASITGEGKTEVSLYLVKEENLNLLVVCPLNVVQVWKDRAKKYGLQGNLADVITYDTFKVTPPVRGVERVRLTKAIAAVQEEATVNPRNAENINRRVIYPNPDKSDDSYVLRIREIFVSNFLRVAEEGAEPKISNRDFVQVREEKLLQLYQRGGRNGLLIIFDEAHKGRNDTDVSQAVCAMASYVMRIKAETRIFMGYLSATLFSKKEQVLNILRIFGIVNKDVYYSSTSLDENIVYDIDRYVKYLEGNFGTRYGKHVLAWGGYSKKDLINESYDLCTKFILPLIRSKTDPRQKQGMSLDVYVQSPEYMVGGKNLLDDAIIRNLIKLKEIQQSIDREDAQSQLITALVERENLRVPLYWSVINTILEEYLSKDRYSVGFDGRVRKVIPKIIVGMNYGLQAQSQTVGIYVLAYYLRVFNPRIKLYLINGKAKDIADQIREFNSLPEPTILIANTASVAEGVSLHDGAVEIRNNDFHYVRYLLTLPQIDAVRAAQFNGRVDRYGNRSFPFILTLYPQINQEAFKKLTFQNDTSVLEESNIIALLADRSFVLNEISGNYESLAEEAESDSFVLGQSTHTVVDIQTVAFSPEHKYEYRQLTESTASNPIRLPGQNNKASNIPFYANRSPNPSLPCLIEFLPPQMTMAVIGYAQNMQVQPGPNNDWGIMARTIMNVLEKIKSGSSHYNPFNLEEVPKYPIDPKSKKSKKVEAPPTIAGSSRYIITDYNYGQYIPPNLRADVRYDFGTMPEALIYDLIKFDNASQIYQPPNVRLGEFNVKAKTGGGRKRKVKESALSDFFGFSGFSSAKPAVPFSGVTQALTSTFSGVAPAPVQSNGPFSGVAPAPVQSNSMFSGVAQVPTGAFSRPTQAPVQSNGAFSGVAPAPITQAPITQAPAPVNPFDFGSFLQQPNAFPEESLGRASLSPGSDSDFGDENDADDW